MGEVNGISTNTLGVILGLVATVLWIFMGLEMGFPFVPTSYISYIVTLGGYRHTVMTILALILIPLCARENIQGFRAAMVLGTVIFALSLISIIDLFITGERVKLLGPLGWLVIQIPVIIFSYRAQQQLIKAA
jgi:hypothetical protein